MKILDGKKIPSKREIKEFERVVLDFMISPHGQVLESRAKVMNFVVAHAYFIIAALQKEIMHHEITEVGVPKGLEEIAKDLQMKRWRVYDR